MLKRDFQLNKTELAGGAGWTNFANASNGCSSPWDVDNNSTRLFGVFFAFLPSGNLFMGV